MRIGHLLKLWRRRNRLTLRVAAGRIGLTAGTLGRLEKGEAMHGVTLATVLVWLMGREEPSGNEAFTFETQDAVAGEGGPEREIEQKRACELERIPYRLGGTETEVNDFSISCDASKSTPGFLGRYDEQGRLIEKLETPGAAIAEEPEAAAERPIHAMDQDAAMCGLREERGGGGAHGPPGVGAEGAG